MENNNYTIKKETQRRVTRFENGKGIWEEYTQWNIFLDDQLITFVHHANRIDEAIRHYEWAKANTEAAAKIGSRFD